MTQPRHTLIHDALSGSRGDDQRRIAEVGTQWVETLLKKNHDYGSSAWTQPVLAPDCDIESAIRVRMSDKIQRLQRLLAGGHTQEVDESLHETISDLGGYCLLYLARPQPATDSAAHSESS